MNKAQVKQARQDVLSKAKRLAKTWYKNGWHPVQTVYCYDCTFRDGSRTIDLIDAENVNGFECIYVDHAYAIVSYDKDGLKVVIP